MSTQLAFEKFSVIVVIIMVVVVDGWMEARLAKTGIILYVYRVDGKFVQCFAYP